MDWKSLKRHPLSAEYADITGKEWELFTNRMKQLGFLSCQEIILHEGMIIDGFQRFRACLETNTEPEFLPLDPSIDARLFVETVNDHRRHESEEERTARRARVAEAIAAGESKRSIAEREKVSRATIDRDLGATGAKSPAEVVGRDGRSQPSKKKVILCRHCEHRQIVGRELIPNCPDCEALRKILKPEKHGGIGVPPAGRPEPLKDDAGVMVPQRLIPVFQARSDYDRAMALLTSCSKAFRAIEEGPTKDAKPLDKDAHFTKFYPTFKSARARLAAMCPSLVCSACGGDGGCDKCYDGWLSKERCGS